MLFVLLLPLVLVAACDKVPLLAPTGSVITLIPTATTVSLNSEVTIIATVIENGVASSGTGPSGGSTTRTGNGTPVQNGTLITFTTTIGRIEPAEARTHNGQVSVKLITGGASGTATITAYSGGASTTTTLKIGSAAASTVRVTSTPQMLGSAGGSAIVQATVTDEGGSPLSGIPVTFSTTKGTVSPSIVNTDASGVATTTLTTTQTAEVTATAGSSDKKGTTTVTVSVAPLAEFTVTPSSTAVGVPVTFTVTPATGANLSNVRIDFGDGTGQSLGAITAKQTVPHVYNSSGVFTATATATDNAGGVGTLTTTVIVGALPVTLKAEGTLKVGEPVTFTATLGTGAVVSHYVWTFDDGTGPFTTTSPQLTHTFAGVGLKTVRVDVFGVEGSKIGTAQMTVDIKAATISVR